MLQNLTTLLATALLTCSTGAKAFAQNEKQKQETTTALISTPKRAYYDPTETYRTTAGSCSNYTSYFLAYSDDWMSPSSISGVVNYSGDYNYVGFGLGTDYVGLDDVSMSYFAIASGDLDLDTFEILPNYLVDVYYNGVFAFTSEYDDEGYGNFRMPKDNLVATSYIWVFDHQETDPIEEMNENIFEAVGDTITGLSDALQAPWDGILNIFYNTTENEVTQMGYLVLIGLGVSITLLVFWTILRLFKQRN